MYDVWYTRLDLEMSNFVHLYWIQINLSLALLSFFTSFQYTNQQLVLGWAVDHVSVDISGPLEETSEFVGTK